MTQSEIEQWKRERDMALRIEDPANREAALRDVYNHRDDLMMTCIQHQADRIKTVLADSISMKADISKIKEEMKPLKESDKDYREAKIEARGMARLITWAKYAVAMGGGAAILKLLGG